MYFWKTKELALQLKENSVSETDQMKYLLSTTIIGLLGFELSSPSTVSPLSLSDYMPLLKFFLVLSITLMGFYETFKTNKANGGSNYLSRIVCLSLPIILKMILISLIYGFFVGLLVINPNRASFLFQALEVFLQIFFFWRLNTHLEIINS